MTNEEMISAKNSSNTHEKEIVSQSPNRNHGTGSKRTWKPLLDDHTVGTTPSNSAASRRLDVTNVICSPSYIHPSDEVQSPSLTTEQNVSSSHAELTEENRQFITLFTQSGRSSFNLIPSPHHHTIQTSSSVNSDTGSLQSSNNNSDVDQRDEHGVSSGLLDYERRLRNSFSETTITIGDDSAMFDNRDINVQNSTQQFSDHSNSSIDNYGTAEEQSASPTVHGSDRNTSHENESRLKTTLDFVNDRDNEHLGVPVAEKERIVLNSREASSEALNSEKSLRQRSLSHERPTPRSSNCMTLQYRETSPVVYNRGKNRTENLQNDSIGTYESSGSLLTPRRSHSVYNFSSTDTVNSQRNGSLSNSGDFKKKIHGASPRTPQGLGRRDFTTVDEESSYDSYSYFMERKDTSSAGFPAMEATQMQGTPSNASTEQKMSEYEASDSTKTVGTEDPHSVVRHHKAKDDEFSRDSNGKGSDMKIKTQVPQSMINVNGQKASVSHAATFNETQALHVNGPFSNDDNARESVDVVESHALNLKKSKFDEEASDSSLDFDGSLPSSFTEQKQAGQARRAVNELLQTVDCQVAAKTFLHVLNEEAHDQSDDRSISSHHSTSSKASLYNKYGVPYANGIRPKSKLQKNSFSTDDESVPTTGERRNSRVFSNDSESVQTSETNSSSSMSLQTTFQRTFTHFRQRLSSSLNAEHYDDLQQLLKEDFEALILKHKKDNRLLSKKYYHEKQKNEAAKAELSVHEEEIRNLKHELSLMDAERDEIEDRLENLRIKEDKRRRAEEAYIAEIAQLKELVGKRDSSNEKSLEKTNSELLKKNASLQKRVDDIEQSLENKETDHAELLKENQSLKQKLEALESQGERASVLKDLLDEISRSKKKMDTAQVIEANELKEKMQEMETKLQSAKSKISEYSKYKDKAVELEKKLGMATDRVVALEKLVDSKERAVKSILEEVGEIREKSMMADDTLQQEISSLKKKISKYEAAELAQRDANEPLQEAHILIKQLEQERGNLQMNYTRKIGELEKKLADKCLECTEMKSEIDRLESIRLGQEETSRESFSVIQNYQSKIVELERRLIEKHDEIFRMREEIQNVNQDLAVKENSYQKNYLSMQRMTVQLKKEKQELEHLFEETSYELDTIKSDLSKTIKEKNRLQQALDDTNSELGSLVAHINEKSQVIEQHSKEIALKNQAYEKLSAELQKTKASSENAEEELSKLLEAMINFEKSETTKDHTISNLLEESEALKLEISTLKASLVDMQKRLESDIDTLKKENRNLSEELGKLKEENAAGRNYFDLAEERSNELEKLRGKLTMSESYCKSLEETIVTMRSDLMKNDVEMIPESESADLKRLQDDLLTSQKQKAELEKRVEHMAKLLSKAESIIARTNTITLSSVMETFRKKDANSLHSHDLLKKI